MIAAGFSGGEAEELRRAFGFKRSERRMKDIEKKVRAGMDKTGIDRDTQESIVQAITSFALYGFPESHAASFALLAYASAYLKCRYLAAFTAALLNNQPMGFYRPATIVKDAQRHGLKIRPIDVTCSIWSCTLEKYKGFALRVGLRYVKGLREEVGKKIVEERAIRKFTSIEDLKLRVPAIQKSELAALAEIGALNFIAGKKRAIHRRDALWQIERAARRAGPLLEAADMPSTELIPKTNHAEPEGTMNLALSQDQNGHPPGLLEHTGSPLAPMSSGRPASHGLSSGNAPAARHPIGHRSSQPAGRNECAHRGRCHSTTASRNGEWLRFPQH